MKRPEQQLQKACVTWLEIQRRLHRLNYFHVPNGTYKSKRMAFIMQGQGLRAGVPDLVLLFPNAGVAFIELKSPQGSLSTTQKIFHAELREFAFEVHTVKTLDALMMICNERMKKGN